jgi:hypothetical protein
MKSLHTIFPALAILLLALLAVWHSQERPESESVAGSQAAAPARPVRVTSGEEPSEFRLPLSSRGLKAPPADLSDIKLPTRPDFCWEEPISESLFEEFRRWATAPPDARTGAGLQHGIELAQQRRHELLNLIERNPRRALELAVPYAIRQQMPEEIRALLEERVDAQGDLLVQSTTLDNDRGCITTRIATLQDGKVFDTYTYGRRSSMPTRDNIAIHGVALDGKLALTDLPGRVLEPAEVAAKLETGQRLEEFPGENDSTEPADHADAMTIVLGEARIVRYRDETQALAALLLAELPARSVAVRM